MGALPLRVHPPRDRFRYGQLHVGQPCAAGRRGLGSCRAACMCVATCCHLLLPPGPAAATAAGYRHHSNVLGAHYLILSSLRWKSKALPCQPVCELLCIPPCPFSRLCAVADGVPAKEAGDLTAAALAAGQVSPVARLKLLQGETGVIRHNRHIGTSMSDGLQGRPGCEGLCTQAGEARGVAGRFLRNSRAVRRPKLQALLKRRAPLDLHSRRGGGGGLPRLFGMPADERANPTSAEPLPCRHGGRAAVRRQPGVLSRGPAGGAGGSRAAPAGGGSPCGAPRPGQDPPQGRRPACCPCCACCPPGRARRACHGARCACCTSCARAGGRSARRQRRGWQQAARQGGSLGPGCAA